MVSEYTLESIQLLRLDTGLCNNYATGLQEETGPRAKQCDARTLYFENLFVPAFRMLRSAAHWAAVDVGLCCFCHYIVLLPSVVAVFRDSCHCCNRIFLFFVALVPGGVKHDASIPRQKKAARLLLSSLHRPPALAPLPRPL